MLTVLTADISLVTLAEICAAFAAIWGAISLALRPLFRMNKDVQQHKNDIDKLAASVEKNEQTNAVVLKSLLAITNHMIDGNGIDKLKEVRDELQASILHIGK